MSLPTILPAAAPYYDLLVEVKERLVLLGQGTVDAFEAQAKALRDGNTAAYAELVPKVDRLMEQQQTFNQLTATLLGALKHLQPAWAEEYGEQIRRAIARAGAPSPLDPRAH